MDTNGQHLAETYLEMLNTHEPDLVNRFVAEDYRNHNAYVADGREANRQFWTSFFTALLDLTATMADLVISGDHVVVHFTSRGTSRPPASSASAPPPLPPSSPRWRAGPSHQPPQEQRSHCWLPGCCFTCASARRSTAHSPPPPTNTRHHPTPAHCNATGTALSCPAPSCRAWQSPRCA